MFDHENGHMAIGLLGNMAIWLLGYWAIWLCGYVAIWVIRLLGYIALWRCGYLAIWPYGHMAIGLYGYMAIGLYGHMAIYLKWHHSRTECKSSLFLLLLICVFEARCHQVPRMATFGDRRLGRQVAEGSKGPLSNTARTPQAKAV